MKMKEPTTYSQAVEDPRWIAAMNEEINALKTNETWEVVDLPEGKKIIESKWVYIMKFDEDWNVTRLKARLIARGDKQVVGKDYKATFSLVAKFPSVRILITLATLKK